MQENFILQQTQWFELVHHFFAENEVFKIVHTEWSIFCLFSILEETGNRTWILHSAQSKTREEMRVIGRPKSVML